MSLAYTIVYKAENVYDALVHEAYWQFAVIPEENDTQELIHWEFNNSLRAKHELSINGLGFKVVRIRLQKKFDSVAFEAKFDVTKKEVNPFDFILNLNVSDDYLTLQKISFRTQHEPFLKHTRFTTLPAKHESIYVFDESKHVFDNLKALNEWVYNKLFFKTGVTTVDTPLKEIIEKRHGVCQDFSHLFCAIARKNRIPTRYVSGYLHQGNGYFGDSQMHAWVEAFVPKVGWVGFDPTNNLLVGSNHIKVSHGKDYNDCSPLKGVVYTSGQNTTRYTVEVEASQQ